MKHKIKRWLRWVEVNELGRLHNTSPRCLIDARPTPSVQDTGPSDTSSRNTEEIRPDLRLTNTIGFKIRLLVSERSLTNAILLSQYAHIKGVLLVTCRYPGCGMEARQSQELPEAEETEVQETTFSTEHKESNTSQTSISHPSFSSCFLLLCVIYYVPVDPDHVLSCKAAKSDQNFGSCDSHHLPSYFCFC